MGTGRMGDSVAIMIDFADIAVLCQGADVVLGIVRVAGVTTVITGGCRVSECRNNCNQC